MPVDLSFLKIRATIFSIKILSGIEKYGARTFRNANATQPLQTLYKKVKSDDSDSLIKYYL
jgi:hypothetical protein